ncbi:palmitoyl-acyl carrier protein thioesterase [Striga asiatica]|uniref:Acyl-[acyl-carrier-protein] hydrolase n=1 Tax=Striga asiatica TaxID=4170 RepID=A0A5A7PT69_STRAF|nr:palmitoyl-acyl carrier protein thioesterase [Striga asiatica]
MALMKQNGMYCAQNKYFTGLSLITRGGFFHGRGKRMCVKMKANINTDMEKVNGKRVSGKIPILDKRSNINLLGEDELSHEYLVGRFVEKRFVFRQSFVIRSYEIGPDKTATMETLMNLLQEWPEMAGKNGMRRDWIIRDLNSRKIITRATSTWVMMNRETRRLSKIPDEVKKEVHPFYLNRAAISTEKADTDKIEKLTDDTAEMIQTGLAPRWSDMDANQHVNNVKYIGWLLESVPIKVLEDYNMTRMTLEYRRECRQSNVLESLTSMKPKTEQGEISENNDLECTHLLRMEADQAEIVRARSVWRVKQHHQMI